MSREVLSGSRSLSATKAARPAVNRGPGTSEAECLATPMRRGAARHVHVPGNT